MAFLDNLGGQNGAIATNLLGLLATESGHAQNPDEAQSNPHAIAGGLRELVNRFHTNGLGGVVQSWLGGGDNQSVEPDQVHDALGSGLMDRLAEKVGIPKDQLAEAVSRFLPGVVDQLSPEGKVPEPHEIQRQFLPDESYLPDNRDRTVNT